jgi:hypothetical protein
VHTFVLISLIVFALFLLRFPPHVLAGARLARARRAFVPSPAVQRLEVAASQAEGEETTDGRQWPGPPDGSAVGDFARELRSEAERLAGSGGVARRHYEGWNCSLSTDRDSGRWFLSILTARERASTPAAWQVAGAVALAVGAPKDPITPAVRLDANGVLILQWREACGRQKAGASSPELRS